VRKKTLLLNSSNLTVTTERESVATLPGGTTTRTLGVVETMTLSMTTGLSANGGKTTGLTTLVNGVGDPVDTGIATDGLVRGVDKDDLKVLVGGILVDPVAVQHTEIGALLTDTLFGGGAEGALVFELVDTLVDGLTIGGTLGNRSLATTTTDTDTVDDISLLGLVTQTTGLVGARGTRSTVNDIQLSEFPTSDTEKETGNIRLLLSGELFEILVGTHILNYCPWGKERLVNCFREMLESG
jgi:hypothetical protein